MSRSESISLDEAARLLRLVGELAEVKGDAWVRGGHLINRLCSIFHAQVGVFAVMGRQPRSESLTILGGVEAGFLDETSQRLLRRYVQESHEKDPLLVAMPPGETAPYTIYRKGSITDSDWYGSEFVNEVKFKMKIDDAIYACYPLPEKGISVGFGINRMRGDRPFGKREHALLQMLNEELGWFHRQVADQIPSQMPPLAPALRRVLAELLNGASEKQIAARLGISQHTVHDHVKRLYQHYGVSSRPELMARFIA